MGCQLREPVEALSILPGHADRHRSTVASPRFALFALGFRPMFLLAATMAALWIPIWVLVLHGVIAVPARFGPMAWHAHEMVFGFAVAVITGFLFTAVRNWTSRPTPSGPALAGLAALWIAGRAVMLSSNALPPVLVGAVDAAFLPLVALSIAVPIAGARQWRNIGFPIILLALGLVNVLFHRFPDRAFGSAAPRVGVDVIVLLMTAIGGRLIPNFTRGAIAGSDPKNTPALDGAVFVSVIAVALSDLLSYSNRICAAICLTGFLLNLARSLRWEPHKTLHVPMIWILHLGYAWVTAGLALKGLSALGIVPVSAATHAFTAGAMTTLILGVMPRVTLAHTGREVVADRWIVLMFVAIAISALLRVGVPILVPAYYMNGITWAAVFWSVAFVIFLAALGPMLVRPRVDGKPG